MRILPVADDSPAFFGKKFGTNRGSPHHRGRCCCILGNLANYGLITGQETECSSMIVVQMSEEKKWGILTAHLAVCVGHLYLYPRRSHVKEPVSVGAASTRATFIRGQLIPHFRDLTPRGRGVKQLHFRSHPLIGHNNTHPTRTVFDTANHVEKCPNLKIKP